MVEDFYAKKTGKDGYKGCKAFSDFRDLLAMKELDAVLIGTPDHWHAIPCVMAARAKKHIYCEKPLSLTLAEGRIIAKEAKKKDIVFQTASQQRSEYGGMRQKEADNVRNGRIGKVKKNAAGVGERGARA